MTQRREVPDRDLQGDQRIERERFKALYDSLNRPIAGFFANRGFPPEECRDMVQETFFRAYRGLERFRGESELTTWVFSIAKHVWMEACRRGSQEKRKGEEVSFETLPQDSRLADAEEQLRHCLSQEQNRLLQDALEELPHQMRCCLQLRLGQDLKYREIAELMETSIGTVKSQLSAAREKLKGSLSGYFARA